MDVKKIAVQTAKRYQTWNPYEIARARDVQIIYAPLKSILGYYTKYKRIQCIILNDNLPYPLQRFVCAHELGHSDKVKYISQIQFHKNRHSLLPLVQLSYHTKFVRRQ